MDKMQAINIAQKYKELVAEKLPVKAIYLYGSYSKGNYREDSDIDICFESNSISLFTLCRLKSELEDLLGCTVDLLRIRKQLEGSYLEKTIKRDMIYV